MNCMTPGIVEVVWPLAVASFSVAVGLQLGWTASKFVVKKVRGGVFSVRVSGNQREGKFSTVLSVLGVSGFFYYIYTGFKVLLFESFLQGLFILLPLILAIIMTNMALSLSRGDLE